MKCSTGIKIELFMAVFIFLLCPVSWGQEVASSPMASPKAENLQPAGPSSLGRPLSSDTQALAEKQSLQDHLAKVVSLSGTQGRVLKEGTDHWVPVQKGMVIGAGDQIITDKDTLVIVSYDLLSKNMVKIDSNTKAEFRSIEPTDLHLEDGSVFNILDGLSGVPYQISTPTAVAAVRGTHIPVSYTAATGAFYAAVLDQNDAVTHAAEITDSNINGSVSTVVLTEGNQVQTQSADQDITQSEPIPADKQDFFGKAVEDVQVSAGVLPELEPQEVMEKTAEPERVLEAPQAEEEKVSAADADIEAMADRATGVSNMEDSIPALGETAQGGLEERGNQEDSSSSAPKQEPDNLAEPENAGGETMPLEFSSEADSGGASAENHGSNDLLPADIAHQVAEDQNQTTQNTTADSTTSTSNGSSH